MHVLRSDGSELHLDDVTDLFDLVADGLAGPDDLLIEPGKPPRLLCTKPDLKWAFVAAEVRPGPYASYELVGEEDDGDEPVILEERDCEVIGEWTPPRRAA